MQEQTSVGTSSEIVWAEPRTNANDFNMINETTQDANNLERALLYLQESPTASNWIDGASGAEVTFDHVDYYADQAFGDGSGVVWNPEIGLYLDNSGEIMSPAINLASEFAHMVEPGGLDPNATPDALWDNSAEAIAHQATNIAAAELGEPTRDNYFDVTPIKVPDITTSGSVSDMYGDTIDTSAAGSFNAGSFDADAFIADYGIDFGSDTFGSDSGFDSYGADSFGSDSGFDSYGSDSFGFDYGSFSADYGIDFGGGFDSFGGGGGGGGFDLDSLFEIVVSV